MEICSTTCKMCQRCPKEETNEAAHLVVGGHLPIAPFGCGIVLSVAEWSRFGVGCSLRRKMPQVLYISVGTVLVETVCASGRVDQGVAD